MLGVYELNRVYEGDCMELSKGIPDNSIDMIFTDPPYHKEYLHLYEWLATEAERVLKPGGALLTYIGNYYKGECTSLAWKMHQDFKFEFIAALPKEGGVIPWETAVNWVKTRVGSFPTEIQ